MIRADNRFTALQNKHNNHRQTQMAGFAAAVECLGAEDHMRCSLISRDPLYLTGPITPANMNEQEQKQ